MIDEKEYEDLKAAAKWYGATSGVKDTVVVQIEYPNGNGRSRFEIVNDGTGTQQRGNYVVTVHQQTPEGGDQKLTTFPIVGFTRWMGIEALASLATELFADAVNLHCRGPAKDTILPGLVAPEFDNVTREQQIEFWKRCSDQANRQLKELEASV